VLIADPGAVNQKRNSRHWSGLQLDYRVLKSL